MEEGPGRLGNGKELSQLKENVQVLYILDA